MIDIGINLTNKQFAGEYDKIIDRAIEAEVDTILLTGTSVRSSNEALALLKNTPKDFTLPLAFTLTTPKR